MEKQEIMERVQEIFRDVFDNEDIVISDETNSDCIEDWDSLTNRAFVRYTLHLCRDTLLEERG